MRPVHPTPATHFDPRDAAPTHPDWRGMTIREYFAGQALVGILSGSWSDDIADHEHQASKELGTPTENLRTTARIAVCLADLLMKELEEEQ